MRAPLLLTLLLPLVLSAQTRILHFTRTSGWDHQTRDESYAMFQAIAGELEIEVDNDATGDPFSDPAVLDQYAAIVFSNTSGSTILDAQQRANFEAWVANGGHLLGIHAASDTYRHSTANGNNTGTWDFYAELLGASVQENPNHVSGTPQYTMELVGMHASTANLPDPWVKNEEYYYWEGGYYGPDNTEVLRVEETIGPNGQVNSYDAPRPMSWYRIEPNGSRVFYTALGHAPSNYTSDMLFRTHLKDALVWLLEGSMGIGTLERNADPFHPNPATHLIMTERLPLGSIVAITDLLGREVLSFHVSHQPMHVDTSRLSTGSYLLWIKNHERQYVGTAGGRAYRLTIAQ